MGNTWTGFSQPRLEAVQDEVLDLVAANAKREGGDVRFQRVHTEVGGGDSAAAPHTLHSIECVSERAQQTGAADAAPPIVILHGYAAGSLLFVRNLAALAQQSQRRIIALDWLGCGASARPKFTATSEHDTIDFFLDSFETWREKRNLAKFDLIAHSMGGYLSVFYMQRGGSRHVDHLVLASPVGFPEAPPPAPNMSWGFRLIRYLWEGGVNPNHLIRGIGPMGYPLVERAVRARFGNTTLGIAGLSPELHGSLFPSYFHLISAGPGSGEHALSRLLAFGAFARLPLLHELPKLNDSKVLVLFGEKDWMRRDIATAEQVAAKMSSAKVLTIPGTHHVYLDPEFDRQVLKFVGA